MEYFKQPISEYIWNIKYRFQHDHEIYDHTITDTWKRVAHAIAHAEKLKQRTIGKKIFMSCWKIFIFFRVDAY